MSAMVERVAKVLFERSGFGLGEWEAQEIELQDHVRAHARAAIEEMRVPTPEMVSAWENENLPELRGMLLKDVFVQRFWPAAINEALK